MKMVMTFAMACSAVVMMGAVSAQAETSNAKDTVKAEQNDQMNLDRWGRRRGPIVRRPWCVLHPRAPRCRF